MKKIYMLFFLIFISCGQAKKEQIKELTAKVEKLEVENKNLHQYNKQIEKLSSELKKLEEANNNLDQSRKQIEILTAEIKKLERFNRNLQVILTPSGKKIFNNEDFKGFFSKFIADSIFQKKRIKFPVEHITWKNDVGGEIDTLKLTKTDWKYESFYLNMADERSQFYDNFELKLQPTNERLVHWYGIGNNGDAKYYFKGTKGKWFLIKIEQLGD